MPFRFRKSLKIGKGFRVNLSKSGISTSIGKPGASLNIGKKGARVTAGIPGTGLSFSKLFGLNKSKPASQSVSTQPRTYQTVQSAPSVKNKTGKKLPLSALIVAAAASLLLTISVCVSSVGGIIFSSPTAMPTVDLVSVQGTALAEAWLSYTQTFQASITDTSIPTATLLPTETLIPTFTSSPQPTATLIVFPTATVFILIQPTSAPITGGCSCGSDTMNCTDFSSWSSAQACYTSCVAAGAGDIHRLDGNNDGSACDSLK